MSRLFDIFPSQNLIFIMGLRRSGTSWVQSILGTHPAICTRVEDNCHEIIWSLRTALSSYNRTLKQLAWENELETQTTTHSSEDFHELVRFFFEMTAKKTLLKSDKNKANSLVIRDFSATKYFGLLAELFHEAKFIYVVRDPRDVAVSTWFHHKRLDKKFQEKIGNLQHHSRNLAREWIKDYNRVFFHPSINKVKWHILRYEDLHENFNETCSELFSFLEVNVPNDKRIDKIKENTDFQNASGGRQSGDIDNTSYLRSGTTQIWQELLEKRTVDIMTAIAGRHMASLNYITEEEINENKENENNNEQSPPLARQKLKNLVATAKKYR